MPELLPHDIETKFREIFRAEPLMVRAPGRINLIGEHTDYNDGFVMPAAIDKEVFFAIGPSDDQRSVIYSVRYDERFEVDLSAVRPVHEPRWANYLLGVLHQFRENGYVVKPFHCVFGGIVPVGAGLSSSAALECGFAVALDELNHLNVPKLAMITMAQWAEHHYAGVKCGIMDQFASVMGKKENVIVLDCRALTHEYVPLNLNGYGIVLCDTKVKHSLVDSEYNMRRRECESGVAILRQHFPEVTSLRDVSPEMLQAHRDDFKGKTFDRCRYVVEEIQRVRKASADLQRGSLHSFGQKMFETHDGLSRLYEVSCKELDFLVAEAGKFDGVIGARMMGGGFGGCTINLVKNTVADAFIARMAERYEKAFGIAMAAYKVNIVDGAGTI